MANKIDASAMELQEKVIPKLLRAAVSLSSPH